MTTIHGVVADRYGPVADAFQRNFTDHGEIGAAFTAYVNGEAVVDVWAGLANQSTDTPWSEDTLQLVFSSTKGAVAICVARLVESGRLDYDQPVASYWPEFAAGGKGGITVAQLMSHQSGLAWTDVPFALTDVLAIEPVVAALAGQRPVWEPGTVHGYHALTYGWLAGELVRRVDGRTVGRYFAEEVARPLNLDFYIGLPESEAARMSQLVGASPPTDPERIAMMMQLFGPGTNGHKAMTLSGAVGGLDTIAELGNDPAVHAVEMPAINGITTARSLARMYAATVCEVDGVRLTSDQTVAAMSAERVNGPDTCLTVPTRFGCGFMLNGEFATLMGNGSFGHPGLGGSLGYADPDHNVGFGYVMNQMQREVGTGPRAVALTDALRSCL